MKPTSLDNLPETVPQIMGILNVNPDSFCDGGRYVEMESAMARAGEMIAEGATIIDVGGESTRPGAAAITAAQEWERIGPVLGQLVPWLQQENPVRQAKGLPAVKISVDTYKAEIARKSLELGVNIINDVSGGCTEPEILDVCAQWNASYILMHNPFVLADSSGRPHAHKRHIHYAEPLPEIAGELAQLYQKAWAAGCRNIILDPGLGFGKSNECNWQLLAGLPLFLRELEQGCPQAAHIPLLIGASNKRFVRSWQESEEVLDAQTDSYQYFLSANLAVCCAAVLAGAQIVRSHEVREHYRCMRTAWELHKWQQLKGGGGEKGFRENLQGRGNG